MKKQGFELPAFQLYLTQNGRKQTTIKRHLQQLRYLLQKVKPFTKENFDQFLLSLKEQGRKNTYLNSLIASVRVYSQFLNLGQELSTYKFLPEEPSIKATMSDKEIEAFLGLPRPPQKGVGKTGWRKWTIFFSIMAFTGMRPGEVAKLTINEVDWGRSVFLVRETKTNYPRLVPIPPNLTSPLRDYLKKIDGQLFPGVDDVDWHYNFHRRIKILGIKRTNLTPYSFRHSFITRLLEEDVNLFKVQKLVGHRRIDSTAVYTHMTIKDIENCIRKHPLIRKSTSPQEILGALIEIIKSFGLEKDERFRYRLSESGHSLELVVFFR